MAKQYHEQNLFHLEPTAKPQGPVECLGMTFENDEKRREYFLEKLREKPKAPEFRKIEGVPIGEDENILAISDPPYYTACPNPFIEDFIKHYGNPYDSNKAGDLEKLRERALMREFEEYRESKQKRLKVFRLEAVCAGFKKAWQERDYGTIIAVVSTIPEKILQEDPKLLMWYDQAVTRTGARD